MRDEINKTEDLQKSVAENVKKVFKKNALSHFLI